MAKCRYCQKEITWMKEGRKNVPIEGDGGIHRCEEMKKAKDSFKTFNASMLSPEEIAKYEKGINEKTGKKQSK